MMKLRVARESGVDCGVRAGGGALDVRVQRVTAQTLLDKKRAGEPITALTAYDTPTARLVDEAGIDVVLVGDSVGMAVLGHETTLTVTMDEIVHHAQAVSRGLRRAFLVVDMPYGSYQVTEDEGVRNGVRLMQETAAQAVKLEGGALRAGLVRRLTEAEVPVVAHLGLTPQSVHRMGGYKVQGRTRSAVETLYEDAASLEAAGAVVIVLEGIPREVAAEVTARAGVPTIGIGAGPECDGQILVLHDLLGLSAGPRAKFVRRYVDGAAVLGEAIVRYSEDVRARSFPSDAESYHLAREVREGLELERLDAERLCVAGKG